jgi:hypothetical protein
MHLSLRARRFLVFLSVALILFAALAPTNAGHAAVAILSVALIFFAMLIVATEPPRHDLVFSAQPASVPFVAPRPPPGT